MYVAVMGTVFVKIPYNATHRQHAYFPLFNILMLIIFMEKYQVILKTKWHCFCINLVKIQSLNS